MQTERKKGARERIVETATYLFHTQGYNATGINQVIREASVAKASLYQHFESKEDLAIAYLKQRHISWFARLEDYVKNDQENTVLSAFRFICYMNERENYRGCSFLNILSEIPANNTRILAVIREHKCDLRDFFRKLLPEEEEQLTDTVYLLFESAIMESRMFRDNWPVQRAVEIVQSLLK
ncbi:TetR/AcrR family transcriptional regulator [Sinomicrobium kalidii]|uniref:TetR/AcrR family transcriptional regulator n=1 Tax=Sinomicrobium kalidii TaxID=2900738 RepID=UPI001E60B259|nr:TetR/AcrR family transcriptional regulator [Sinomicrobium kalidii]UGU17120.1 TetR/AcrR family transcriptional regulator [Sinomicrobium kalidii]